MVYMRAEAHLHGAMGLSMKGNLNGGKYVAEANLHGQMAIIMKVKFTMGSEKVKAYFIVKIKIMYIRVHGNRDKKTAKVKSNTKINRSMKAHSVKIREMVMVK